MKESFRLTRAEFSRSFERGVPITRPLGTLKISALPLGKRLAIVISGKAEKSAAARNRMRRRLTALFRAHAAGIPSAQYIFIVKKEAFSYPKNRLAEEFDILLFDGIKRLAHTRL